MATQTPPSPVNGLHHVTAIASDAAANHRFWTRALGLRFVKKTVNFDDPGTYHLYYGDTTGSAGSAMTFFPWAGTPRGRRGIGETTLTRFSVPAGSLDFWQQRLADAGANPRPARAACTTSPSRSPTTMPTRRHASWSHRPACR